jgi:hypothetical protein
VNLTEAFTLRVAIPEPVDYGATPWGPRIFVGREIHAFAKDVADVAFGDVPVADDLLYLFFSASEESQRKAGEFLTRILTRTEFAAETIQFLSN